jgi:hypothetical protein
MRIHLLHKLWRKASFGDLNEGLKIHRESHNGAIAENNKRKDKVKFMIRHVHQIGGAFSFRYKTKIYFIAQYTCGMNFAELFLLVRACSIEVYFCGHLKSEPYK